MTPKRVVLLRHAKSSWSEPGRPDHDRPLNERGRKAAALVGRHLRREGWLPDLVLCSSAARTRETLQLLDLPEGHEVRIDDRLYGASAPDLLARIREVPDGDETLLLIGHNPGIEDLGRLLDRDGLEFVEKFPTAAVAVLALTVSAWPEIRAGAARLDVFFTPKDLA